MTLAERDLLGTLKACVLVLNRHADYLNSDDRRQLRRAMKLVDKLVALDKMDQLDAELLAGAREEARGDDRV
jgi:hypothetical protein